MNIWGSVEVCEGSMEQYDAKSIREIAATMVAETCSTTKKIKELESELAFLMKSDVFALTAL